MEMKTGENENPSEYSTTGANSQLFCVGGESTSTLENKTLTSETK